MIFLGDDNGNIKKVDGRGTFTLTKNEFGVQIIHVNGVDFNNLNIERVESEFRSKCKLLWRMFKFIFFSK